MADTTPAPRDPGGSKKRQVVLDVALRLGKLLKQRLGADVIFTRDNDTFIPLETRTAIANKAQADLFLSIHANSSPDSSARGVETYYLNFTTSPDALEVAARENAVSDESIHELSDLVKKITLKDKIDESREFAADVQKSLYGDLEDGNPGLRDRGVKKAPFVVLIGANMPSILAEISFLTNSDDARELQQPAYRQRIAESLYRGVAQIHQRPERRSPGAEYGPPQRQLKLPIRHPQEKCSSLSTGAYASCPAPASVLALPVSAGVPGAGQAGPRRPRPSAFVAHRLRRLEPERTRSGKLRA